MKFLIPVFFFAMAGCVSKQPVPLVGSSADDLADYPRYDISWAIEGEYRASLELSKNSDGLYEPVLCISADGFQERFLVDTGAEFTTVRKQFLARHAHRTTRFQSVIVSFRHEHTDDIFALGPLNLAFATVREMPARIAQEEDLEFSNQERRKVGKEELVGIVGIDFLMAFGAQIDLRNAEIVLRKPNQPPQRNAGSRPSSGDSPASETPSSPGPCG